MAVICASAAATSYGYAAQTPTYASFSFGSAAALSAPVPTNGAGTPSRTSGLPGGFGGGSGCFAAGCNAGALDVVRQLQQQGVILNQDAAAGGAAEMLWQCGGDYACTRDVALANGKLAWNAGNWIGIATGTWGIVKAGLRFTLAEASEWWIAARGTTTLYRSVSAAEHADIAASGALRAGPNSFSTGKWFWESAESAARFGSKMDGPGNFRIIEATFPRSAADQFMRLERLDGIGPARFGTFEQLGTPSLRPWLPSP